MDIRAAASFAAALAARCATRGSSAIRKLLAPRGRRALGLDRCDAVISFLQRPAVVLSALFRPSYFGVLAGTDRFLLFRLLISAPRFSFSHPTNDVEGGEFLLLGDRLGTSEGGRAKTRQLLALFARSDRPQPASGYSITFIVTRRVDGAS